MVCFLAYKTICFNNQYEASKYFKHIWIANCQKLKRMPICLPLLENGPPSGLPSLQNIFIYPREWWEYVVEWDHSNAKNVLHPFVKFL